MLILPAAMLENPEAAVHMEKAAKIAEKFEPHYMRL